MMGCSLATGKEAGLKSGVESRSYLEARICSQSDHLGIAGIEIRITLIFSVGGTGCEDVDYIELGLLYGFS
jgi:hypothetical protein